LLFLLFRILFLLFRILFLFLCILLLFCDLLFLFYLRSSYIRLFSFDLLLSKFLFDTFEHFLAELLMMASTLLRVLCLYEIAHFDEYFATSFTDIVLDNMIVKFDETFIQIIFLLCPSFDFLLILSNIPSLDKLLPQLFVLLLNLLQLTIISSNSVQIHLIQQIDVLFIDDKRNQRLIQVHIHQILTIGVFQRRLSDILAVLFLLHQLRLLQLSELL